MNQIITDVPFGDGTLEAVHDTSTGELEMDTGHIEGADVTVTPTTARQGDLRRPEPGRPGCRRSCRQDKVQGT